MELIGKLKKWGIDRKKIAKDRSMLKKRIIKKGLSEKNIKIYASILKSSQLKIIFEYINNK